MVFSGGGPGLLATIAVITKQSPEETDFTLPLYHPVAPVVDDAISTASLWYKDLQPNQTNVRK
nr:uncharacterized protein LOC112492412 [Ziziphus jujuba var. spinosa]